MNYIFILQNKINFLNLLYYVIRIIFDSDHAYLLVHHVILMNILLALAWHFPQFSLTISSITP